MKRSSPTPLIAAVLSGLVTAGFSHYRAHLPVWLMSAIQNLASYIPIPVPAQWKELFIVFVAFATLAMCIIAVLLLYLSILSARWKQTLARTAAGKINVVAQDDTRILSHLYRKKGRK